MNYGALSHGGNGDMGNLIPRRRAFVEEYLKCWNATEAARRVGYGSPNNQGPRLLLNAIVQEHIKQRISELEMSTNEVALRLAEHARGDIGNFMDIESIGYSLNLDKAKKLGLTHLIRKVKDRVVMTSNKDGEETETHTLEVELYDAQAALDKIARINSMYKDNIDVTSGGKVIEVVIGNKET